MVSKGATLLVPYSLLAIHHSPFIRPLSSVPVLRSPMSLSLSVRTERWPIAGAFTISRGAKTEAAVVVAELSDGRHRGRGECVPYARYGESFEGVLAAIGAMAQPLARGLDRAALQSQMPAGAARNALDCAFWDLSAKQSARRVHEIAGLPPPRALLKIKLGAPGDPERIAAVRRAAPRSELIADANEGWTPDDLEANLAACADAGVTLLEQPLPADADDLLARAARPLPVCADESAHGSASLAGLLSKYEAVNLKLDKAGGLTEALAMARQAEALGLDVMVGCMVATSLAMAPAILVAQRARFVDLDGPLLLERDRPHGLRYADSIVHPATPELWG